MKKQCAVKECESTATKAQAFREQWRVQGGHYAVDGALEQPPVAGVLKGWVDLLVCPNHKPGEPLDHSRAKVYTDPEGLGGVVSAREIQQILSHNTHTKEAPL